MKSGGFLSLAHPGGDVLLDEKCGEGKEEGWGGVSFAANVKFPLELERQSRSKSQSFTF